MKVEIDGSVAHLLSTELPTQYVVWGLVIIWLLKLKYMEKSGLAIS